MNEAIGALSATHTAATTNTGLLGVVIALLSVAITGLGLLLRNNLANRKLTLEDNKGLRAEFIEEMRELRDEVKGLREENFGLRNEVKGLRNEGDMMRGEIRELHAVIDGMRRDNLTTTLAEQRVFIQKHVGLENLSPEMGKAMDDLSKIA